MRTHFKEIRTNPLYSEALIVVYIEHNSNYIHADNICKQFKTPEFEPIHFDTRDRSHRVGVLTTNPTKEQSVGHMQRCLLMNQLRYAESFISTDMKQNKITFEDQLHKYRKDMKLAKDAFGKGRYGYSGKGPNEKDDVIMAVLLAMHWSWIWLKDPNQERLRVQYGGH